MLGELPLGHDIITGQHIFRIQSELRFRHAYLVGRTGAGKSTLLHNFLQRESEGSHAVILFDAGDLATALLETLSEEALQRVHFFSADHPIAYNPLLRRVSEPGRLENELGAPIDQVVAESSSTGSLSARMKRVLSAGIRGVLTEPEPTLATLTTYLLEQRTEIRKRLELRDDEFTIAFEGLIDRLSQFLRDARVRRILCAKHELNFDAIIDNGEILIVSLAGLEKPLVRFLGTVLFHGLSSVVMERPTWARKDLSIVVDEFQDYLGSVYSLANFQMLFAQGRRHKVSLTVAHQDFGTIDSRLLHTIHANAAATISFSCGPDESKKMSEIFGAKYPRETVGFLPDHQAIARIGESIRWFQTFPPPMKIRDIIPDEGVITCENDPPDPLEAFANRRAERDVYRDTRKPRRVRPTMTAPEADLPG
jgi:type IV secretory pathway VirB4 component